MSISGFLQQSAVLTLLGMAVVFAFLWLMIICITLTGKAVHRMGWDKDVEPEAPKSAGGTAPGVTAAISAAVTEYRKEQG